MLILELSASLIHMLENTKTAFISSFTEQQQKGWICNLRLCQHSGMQIPTEQT